MKILLRLALCIFIFTVESAAADEDFAIRYATGMKGKLAFSVFDKKNSDIYVLNFADKTVKPLIVSPKVDEYPAWSPDGKKLAFYSDRTGDREIFVSDENGQNIQQLTNMPGFDEDPDWSPDGRQIVFHSGRLGKGQNLFIMESNGHDPQALTDLRSRNTIPRWNPDGKSIMFSTDSYWPGWDLILYTFDTHQTKKLTSGFQTYCRGAWAPDGKHFVYSHGIVAAIDLYIGGLGEEFPQQITKGKRREYDAIWTKDNKWIYYVSEAPHARDFFELYSYEVATGINRQLLEGKKSVRYLSWTP